MDEGMNKICTSLEQSKKLVELGIDVDTADMRYGYIAPYEYSDRMYEGGYDEVPYPKDFLKKNPNFSENDYDGEFPAWSLSALLELMPERIKIGEELSFCLTSKKSLSGFSFGYNLNGSTIVQNNPLDAAFEMVCWLKENGKI